MRNLIFCLFFYSASVFCQDTGALLADAIQVSNSINNNNSVEQRLSKYEKIQGIVSDIISANPGSRESLLLLSGQNVGNFDYSTVQSNYVKELADYYETVCVVAPNFECLGFVSLKEGRKYCKADTYRQLDQAHGDIQNALYIFQGQESKKEYFNLALNSFRACASLSLLENTSVLTDRYASALIPILLDFDKIDEARAIVQQVQHPFFKFQSALAFQIETKGLNKENIDRFETYIKKNLATDKWLFWLASLALHERGVALVGSSRLNYEPASNPNFGSFRISCEDSWLRNYYEIGTQLVDTTISTFNKAPPSELSTYRESCKNIIGQCCRCKQMEPNYVEE